jgi:hypothetical protein
MHKHAEGCFLGLVSTFPETAGSYPSPRPADALSVRFTAR